MRTRHLTVLAASLLALPTEAFARAPAQRHAAPPASAQSSPAPAAPSSGSDGPATAGDGAKSEKAEDGAKPEKAEDSGSTRAEQRPKSRPVPDYDGRPEETSFADGALWVPRVVLFPLYLVSEYVVRKPIGWLVSTAEREHWPSIIVNFLTFGDRQGGIVPTWLVDFGLRPSIGVYGFWNDFLTDGNDLRFRAAYGGEDLYQLRLTDRFPVGTGQLSLNANYESRPDNVFHGVGRFHDDARSRYYRAAARGGVIFSAPWHRSSYARLGAGVREVRLDGSRTCCNDPSVAERVAAGAVEYPAGMDQVFDTLDQAAEVVLDSRWPRNPDLPRASDYAPPPGHGVRVALRGDMSELVDQSLAPLRPLADAWVHFGVSLGGYVDVTGHQRSLGLTAVVDFVDPIGEGEVPVTDLVSLGGDRPLRGFLSGEFVDRSAAALRLDYRWPVAVWLDGTLQYEVGNVFEEHLSGFDIGQMRSSYGFGLQAVGAQDHVFQLLVAVGTESYDAGAGIDSLRIVFGTTAGF